MKKILILLLCAAVLSAVLCGCVEKAEQTDGTLASDVTDASQESGTQDASVPDADEPAATLPTEQEKTPANEPLTKPTGSAESTQPTENTLPEDNRPTVDIPEPVTPPDVRE